MFKNFKFHVGFAHGFGLAVYVDTYPSELAVTVMIACFNFYFEFGKAWYEEQR